MTIFNQSVLPLIAPKKSYIKLAVKFSTGNQDDADLLTSEFTISNFVVVPNKIGFLEVVNKLLYEVESS